MLHSRRQHLDVLFRIDAFSNKISCSSILNTVSLCVLTQTIRNHSVFDALHCAEASPSARHVTTDNAVCRLTDIFDHIDISPKNINKSCVIEVQLAVHVLYPMDHTLKSLSILSILVYSLCLLIPSNL
jgi:hypothetical protein